MGNRALLVCMAILVAGCDVAAPPEQAARPELLIYCGITMAHPIKDIATIMEREKNVKVLITQGGSRDLYESLKASGKGDLYLPGSASYRERNLSDGLLTDFVPVGYNQAALIVAKGNPKGVSGDVRELTRKDLSVVVGNPNTGSIGRETKQILAAAGVYDAVLDNAVYLTTDSRNLNRAIRNGEADVILNWRATAFFDENRGAMDIVDLDPAIAKPKKLLLNRLSFSEHADAVEYFMQLAASEQGQAIFRKHGFLDNTATF